MILRPPRTTGQLLITDFCLSAMTAGASIKQWEGKTEALTGELAEEEKKKEKYGGVFYESWCTDFHGELNLTLNKTILCSWYQS